MATVTSKSPPLWFWIAAALALLWNAWGVAIFLQTIGLFGDPLASLSPSERAAMLAVPRWTIGIFALGTFSGLIGSAGLLLRKNWAQPVLILSLIALLVLEGWVVFLSGNVAEFGLAVPVMVSVAAILIASLAIYARRRGWLRQNSPS